MEKHLEAVVNYCGLIDLRKDSKTSLFWQRPFFGAADGSDGLHLPAKLDWKQGTSNIGLQKKQLNIAIECPAQKESAC